MLCGVPFGLFTAGVFDQRVLRLHAIARGKIRQIGNAQVHGGDTGEAPVIGIQGRRDSAEAGHDSLDCGGVVKSAAEQPFDLALLAHDKALAAPCDDRRAAEQQPIGRARQAEIVFASFAETPELESSWRRGISRTLRQMSMTKRHWYAKSLILRHIPPKRLAHREGSQIRQSTKKYP